MPREPAEIPPQGAVSTRLPRPVSSFVGREDEIADIVGLVREGARLVTLTGSGGAGKTRLCLEVALGLAPDFGAAVHWLSLAVIRDPDLVIPTIADALGAHDDLAGTIGSGRTLLLLDNFEQVVAAAPELAALLEACPNLYAIVTSRELLGLPGETEFAVPPLTNAEAIALFCARSRSQPDDVTEELCRRLDNLPLALELAAARARVLSPAQILARLSDRLDLFRAGRGVDPRQRTLRAAIEWSCQLLEPADLRLFARLGVFAGGCTLEAAEAVAAADVNGLQSLVDKNLLRHAGERFWMLETIREYAAELLAADAELENIRMQHASWCISFLEESERLLLEGRADVVPRMEAEFANVRAAFHWCITTDRVEEALRLVRPRVFWQAVQTHSAEGQQWMQAVLARSQEVQPALRRRALATAGDLLRVVGDLDGARHVLEEACNLRPSTDDDLAESSYALGRVEMAAGNYGRADEVTRTGLAAARRTSGQHLVAGLSAQLVDISYRLGDLAGAAELAAEASRIARTAGDLHSEGDVLRVLAMIHRDRGDFAQARTLIDDAVVIMRGISDTYCVSSLLAVLGDVELREERPDAARAAFIEALEAQRMLAQWRLVADSIWGVAAADVAIGRFDRAAVLLTAEEVLRTATATPLHVTSAERHAAARTAVERALDPAALTKARQRGRALNRDAAIDMAVTAPDVAAVAPVSPAAAVDDSAIRREGEIWTVRFNGSEFRLKDGKGVRYLATLLRSPGRELHVLELVGAEHRDPATSGRTRPGPDETMTDPGSTEPVLDQQAKLAYRARLQELEEDLAEATAWSDVARAAKIKTEQDFLTSQLAAAVGLGGRDRHAASAAERARVNVTRAIRSVVQRIKTHDPTLAEHLDATLHTGTFCSYTPDPRRPVHWAS